MAYQLGDVVKGSRATEHGDRNIDRSPHSGRQVQVVSLHRPIPVDGVDDDLAGASVRALSRELNRIETRGARAIGEIHLVLRACATDIEHGDDALSAHASSGAAQEVRMH